MTNLNYCFVLIVICLLCLMQLTMMLRHDHSTYPGFMPTRTLGQQNQTLTQLSLELKRVSDSVKRSAERLAHLRGQSIDTAGGDSTTTVAVIRTTQPMPTVVNSNINGATPTVSDSKQEHDVSSSIEVSVLPPYTGTNVNVNTDSRSSTVPVKLVPASVPVPGIVPSVPLPLNAPTSAATAAKRAAIFTMDSFPAYEENSRKGGAAGELLIRYSLQHAFDRLNVKYTVIQSDEEFAQLRASEFDFIILDPWTWAGKGWVAKPVLKGQDHKVFMLDFFGFHKLPNQSLKVPDHRFLTAYGGSPTNTFLGYYLPSTPPFSVTAAAVSGSKDKNQHRPVRKNQGVIWGKDPKHYEGAQRVRMLKAVAAAVAPKGLISTATRPAFVEPNIQWVGHRSREQWSALLSESKFVLGLGDPLLGPSAIDAISAGCVYINILYDKPVRDGHFPSQHPYAMENIGAPRVCSARIADVPGILACVKSALAFDLEPIILPDFTEEAYLQRVRTIFDL